MVVVDSDVLIWLLRDDATVKAQFEHAVIETQAALHLTPVQIAELYAGMRPKETLKTDNFIDSFSIIAIDKNIGRLAGSFIREYGKSHGVTLADALIGASAKAKHYRLWTLNRRHYPMLAEHDFFKVDADES